MKWYKEFREFAVKGNMIDMAIGIMIGAAFGKVISSLVEDLFMPPLLYLSGQVKLSDWRLELLAPLKNPAGEILKPGIVLTLGNFLQYMISFCIIAIVLFFIVKITNQLRKKAENPANTQIPTPRDIELLTEIRNLLAENNKLEKKSS